MERTLSSTRWHVAKPLTLVLAAVLLVLVLVVSVSALSAYRMSTVRKGWDSVLGSWDEVMQRYPATEANASALELERLVSDLGLVIAPRHTERWKDLSKKRSAVFDHTGKGPKNKRAATSDHNQSVVFFDYGMKQLKRAERGRIDPPPPELSSYIAKYDEELVTVRRHLNRGVVPVWESDLSAAEIGPIPNVLGHYHLQKLLASVALARLYAGDSEGAQADIEAAWHLSQSLGDSPILLNQLMLIMGVRMQLGVLRQIPDVDEVWLDRLTEHDYRESFISAMKHEGRGWLYYDDPLLAVKLRPSWKLAAARLVRPYAKLYIADMSDAWREWLVKLDQVGAICDRPMARLDADLEIPQPWSVLGGQLTPDPELAGTIDRLASLELDLELTRLLIEADAERRANGGAWPESLTAIRNSDACPDDRWRYSVTDEGLEIALTRDVRWPNQKGTILPTRVMAH